jgi:hypothetical protein
MGYCEHVVNWNTEILAKCILPYMDAPMIMQLTRKPFTEVTIHAFARLGDWEEIPPTTNYVNQGIRFRRPYGGGFETITYWFLSKRQTIRTYLPDHPKHGPGQMHSTEALTRDELRRMFVEETGPGTGLRLHTKNKRRRDNAL